MELEVFVHGALCIAYSGRCLLSGYFNHRDPNQGTCTNSCRWDYKVKDAEEDATGDIQKIDFDFDQQARAGNACRVQPNSAAAGAFTGNDSYKAMGQSGLSDCGSQQRHPAADKVYLISRPDHPDELMPVLEDEHGTYIMNSKDLRAVEHVERLAKIGIDSLKIEGRTKSIYYVARTAQVYRQAIDDAVAGLAFNTSLLGALDALANRGYTDGFYERHHTHEQQNYLRGHSESTRQQYVGDIVSCADGMALIDVKNRFSVGDKLEIIHPDGNSIIDLAAMRSVKGEVLTVAPGSGHKVQIPLQGDMSKGMVARFL
jgi:putative protease